MDLNSLIWNMSKKAATGFFGCYVDKEGGIDIDDCGRISEYLSEQLDENDPIPDAYFLEVSSPGAERPLKKPEDVTQSGRQTCICYDL